MSLTNNLLAAYFDFYPEREARLTLINEVKTALEEKNWYLENNPADFAVNLSEKSREVLSAMNKAGFKTVDVIIFATGRAKELNVKSSSLVA